MLSQALKSLVLLIKSKKGQGMVEYGLIIGLIAVVVILVLTGLGEKIRDLFKGVSDTLPTVTSGS